MNDVAGITQCSLASKYHLGARPSRDKVPRSDSTSYPKALTCHGHGNPCRASCITATCTTGPMFESGFPQNLEWDSMAEQDIRQGVRDLNVVDH